MSDKKYYLGIDGGGSKTAFCIIDEENKIVFEKTCGPTSLDTIDYKDVKNVFIEGVNQFTHKIESVFAGIGGIANDSQIKRICCILKELPICDEHTKVEAGNDVINALYGSLNGNDGIVLIAGTGSVCFGKNQGKFVRVGGYCYQEGDAGSGYDLGFKALQYFARVLDHRYPESNFSKAISKEINCYNYQDLVNYFTKLANRTEIAKLSKIVTKYSNDENAKRIIEQAIDEVILMIKTVHKSLKFNEKMVLFSIVGSLGNADTYYKEYLLNRLREVSDNIVFQPKIYEASYGSALKAKEIVE